MSRVCSRCGVQLTSSRLSICGIAVTVLCGSFLLVILIPVFCVGEQRIERRCQQILDRMVWREPLDSWSQ